MVFFWSPEVSAHSKLMLPGPPLAVLKAKDTALQHEHLVSRSMHLMTVLHQLTILSQDACLDSQMALDPSEGYRDSMRSSAITFWPEQNSCAGNSELC